MATDRTTVGTDVPTSVPHPFERNEDIGSSGDGLPIMPLYTGRLMTSGHYLEMDGMERGVYLAMLVAQWNLAGRGLPADEDRLCRMLALSPEQWSGVAAAVLPRFLNRGGRLFNETLERIWGEQKAKQQQAREAGRKSGESRRQRTSARTDVPTDGEREMGSRSNGRLNGRSNVRSTSVRTDVEPSDDPMIRTSDDHHPPPTPPFEAPAAESSAESEEDLSAAWERFVKLAREHGVESPRGLVFRLRRQHRHPREAGYTWWREPGEREISPATEAIRRRTEELRRKAAEAEAHAAPREAVRELLEGSGLARKREVDR